jgi:endonuclease/exonuclease/phosphatase family metal-dependent hydrolase
VRPLPEQYENYRQAILKRIISFDTTAFILLQEVDTLSRRSYYENQFRSITQSMPSFRSYFGVNYDSWVPVPPQRPMGKVKSGLVTLSKFLPSTVKRVSFESSYSWPMRLFQLKRCYLETRYNTTDGKELVLINTHNSAFDDAASLREKELNTLRSRMLDEYAKGNYVIIGGDWNQNPASFDSTFVLTTYKSKTIKPGIPEDFTPEGWKYAYDPLHTTNRDVNIPYTEGETITSLIDFFVISPKVNLQYVKTVQTGFVEADHQPVVMRVVL